ncbi:MAG: type II toxin-antitoxin system HicB family antitoxin [Chloroflexota bacterium]
MMEYKGYIAQVEFDDESDIFHGEVINLRDVVTFEGESVAALKEAFQESIEDYLAFCAERGEDPEKPYSGKFSIRMDPELHRRITVEARRADKSLNTWINDALTTLVTEH